MSVSSANPVRGPLWRLAIANLLLYAGVYLCQAVVPLAARGMGVGPLAVGWVGTAFFLATLTVRVPAGHATDRFGSQRPLVVGALLAGAASLLLALAGNPLALGLCRALQGMGLALFTTALAPRVAEGAETGRMTSAFSRFGISTNMAAALGPLAGIQLFEAGRPGAAYVLAAFACGAAALLAVRTPGSPGPPHADSEPRLPPSPLPSVGIGPWWPFVVAIGAFGITYAVHVDFVPVLAASRAIPAFGVYYTTYAAIIIVTRTLSGRIGDRFGRIWMVVPGGMAALAALFLLSQTTHLGELLVVAGLYAIAAGSIHPAVLAGLVERAPRERRGIASAVFYLAYDGGIALGGPSVGLLLARVPGSFVLSLVGGIGLTGTIVLAVFGSVGRPAPHEAREASFPCR